MPKKNEINISSKAHITNKQKITSTKFMNQNKQKEYN